MVASWSQTQEVAGSYYVMTNIFFAEFSENNQEQECIPVGCVPPPLDRMEGGGQGGGDQVPGGGGG